jgi:hypothetical protein
VTEIIHEDRDAAEKCSAEGHDVQNVFVIERIYKLGIAEQHLATRNHQPLLDRFRLERLR